MKIGIDVTPIIYEGTGVGDYTFRLVAELLKQNPDDNFVLFYSTMKGFGKIKERINNLVMSIQKNREELGNNLKRNYQIVGLPFPPWFWQLVWNRLNIIKIETFTGKLDIFHCWDYLIPPSKCLKVVTIHDATPLLFPETHTEKIIANYKLLLAKIKKEKINVITISKNSKKDLVKFGIEEKSIAVVYNGNNFPIIEEKDVVYQKEKYILSVGNRNPRKNIKKIVEAFSAVADKYPELELRIVGNYGWGENDESRIKNLELRIKNKIKIFGYVNDKKLVEFYKKATCLVYPSFYEGFGLPILEAMSLGCPVITSNVSSMPEVGGSAALYVNPESAKEIENSIIRIIEEIQLRKDLIRRGLEQAKKFSWGECARETREEYKKVLSSRQ